MSDYHEFRRQAIRKKRVRMARRVALVALVLAVLLGGCGFAAYRWLNGGAPQDDAASGGQSQPESAAPSGTAAAADEDAADSAVYRSVGQSVDWNRLDYGVRTLNTTVQMQDDGTTAMDYRLAGQTGNNGRVDMSYFDSTVFLGDSLSHGLQIYETGIPNAQYCVYTGAGPQAVVNGQEVKRATDKVPEIVMDSLVAKNPDRIYILFGTNVLTRDTAYTSFLAYYSQMIDMIQAALPHATLYIQSITPVRPELRREKPGLYKERLMAVNDELAALALQKGCYFVDIWEALADENGDLKEDIAQGDGYHVKPAGYTLWVEYLRTHTEYTPGVLYEAGTSYYIE